MTFLEAAHISLIQEYVCAINGQNLLEVLGGRSLNLERTKIDSWQEVGSFTNSAGIFSEELTLILVDVQDLQPILGLESLFNLNENSSILFWSSTEKNWLAPLQKIWTSSGAKYVKLAPNKDTFKNLVNQYLVENNGQNNFKLTNYQTEKLINSCSNYQELVDKLDLLSVSNNPEELLTWFEPEAATELFRLPFRLNNLAADTKLWVDSVPDDDTQFALSILWGKAEKLGRKDILQLIIKTDLEMKTRSKIPPILQFKKLMFEIGNL